MVECAPDPQGSAAWPVLRQGFFAGVPGVAPSRPLGLAAPAGPRGGPVFDAAGRWVGVGAMPTKQGCAGGDCPVGWQSLRGWLGVGMGPVADASAAARVDPGVAYELALRGAVQVLDDGRDA
jgi:hypothetical protein